MDYVKSSVLAAEGAHLGSHVFFGHPVVQRLSDCVFFLLLNFVRDNNQDKNHELMVEKSATSKEILFFLALFIKRGSMRFILTPLTHAHLGCTEIWSN